MSATTSSRPRIDVLGVAGAIAVTSLVVLLPAPAGLSPPGQRLAAMFLGILVLWSTEALPIAVTALLALALQPIFGLASLRDAFSSFVSPVFFFVLVMFTIAYAWLKTGLARRFALFLIAKAGSDAKRVVFVFMLGTGVLSMVVSDVPCAAVFMGVALGLFGKLDLAPGSQFAKAIMMGIPIAALIGGVGTPAGSSINILGLMMIEQNGGPRVPFLHWMAMGIPMVLVLLPFSAWLLVRLLPPEIQAIGEPEEILRERRQLGRMGPGEWKVLVIMTLMVSLWVASTWFPAFDTVLVGMCGAAAMFLPGIKLFAWKEVQEATGWDALLMIGGVTSLGAASAKTGLANWLAASVLDGVQDWNVALLLLAISAFTVIVHLMLPIAPVINAVMIPPIMVLGAAAGMNPTLYALPVVFTASCAFLLPLDAVPLVTYSKGYYRMFDMLLPGAIISFVWVIVMTAILMLVGPMLGLFEY